MALNIDDTSGRVQLGRGGGVEGRGVWGSGLKWTDSLPPLSWSSSARTSFSFLFLSPATLFPAASSVLSSGLSAVAASSGRPSLPAPCSPAPVHGLDCWCVCPRPGTQALGVRALCTLLTAISLSRADTGESRCATWDAEWDLNLSLALFKPLVYVGEDGGGWQRLLGQGQWALWS